jgi:hypothetical protein
MSESREVRIAGHSKQYIPRLVSGDDDWDEGFNGHVTGDSEIFNGNTVRIQVRMYGQEREPDRTTVDGKSGWQDIYTAPLGWKIRSVMPLGSTSQEFSFQENQTLQVFDDTGDGAVVSKFEVYGFEGENPHTAGSYTKVIAYFNAMNVVIESE